MPPKIKYGFLLLVLSQTLHSFEEYRYSLWAVFEPARFVSSLISDDLAFGFAVVNSALVIFGFWTYLMPVSRGWGSASIFLWGWCVIELGNGIAHSVFAIQAEGYFPGVYTAPLLTVFSCYVGLKILQNNHDQAAP